MRRHLALLTMALIGATLGLAPTVGATGERASGSFVDGAGNTIGEARLEQVAVGTVRLTITLRDATVVTPGQHGIHFHAVGACAGPDFATAGPHFNPTARMHGAKNPQGPHAGDLPNLTVTTAADGPTATLTTTAITLAGGPATIFDADGTALVIHANPDDEATDPAGNSGGRVACAVLKAVVPGMPNTGGGGGQPSAVWLLGSILAGTLGMGGLLRRRAHGR